MEHISRFLHCPLEQESRHGVGARKPHLVWFGTQFHNGTLTGPSGLFSTQIMIPDVGTLHTYSMPTGMLRPLRTTRQGPSRAPC